MIVKEEKIQNKRRKIFLKMIKDKNIFKIERVTYLNKEYYFFHFMEGQIFKCTGWIIDNSVIIEFSKKIMKPLFKIF